MGSSMFHRLAIRSSRVPVLHSQLFLAFLLSAAWCPAASSQEVELKLTVLSASQPGMLEKWRVTLRKASGGQALVRVIDSSRPIFFKQLEPDIYLACLQSANRRKCQSIDMFLPEGQTRQQFTMTFTPVEPLLNTPGAHSVKLSALQVPLTARHEMIESEKAEIRGDEADSLAHLKRATEIDGVYLEALNNLGAIYGRSGNRELSCQYFSKAVQVDPDFGLAWMNLAGELLADGQWEEALKASLQAAAHAPDDAMANSQLALSYFSLGRYSDAERIFRKVFELDPAFADMPMLYLASLSLMRNDQMGAENYIGAFLRIHPYSPDAPAWKRKLRALVSGSSTSQSVISANLHPN